MHNTAYILHIYCIYICLHIRHVYSIHTAYVHTYTCMLHACCTHNTSVLHACCIHKNWLSATRIIQAYEEMYAVYVQLFTCSMYAAHKNCTHLALHLFRCVRPHVHVCGMRVVRSQFFVYAACMQYGCIVCAARVQCAARKQIYVQQHTSNISVRNLLWLLTCQEQTCIAWTGDTMRQT